MMMGRRRRETLSRRLIRAKRVLGGYEKSTASDERKICHKLVSEDRQPLTDWSLVLMLCHGSRRTAEEEEKEKSIVNEVG